MTLSQCLYVLSSFSSSLSDTVKNPRSKHVTQANATIPCFERSKERIKKMFDKIELSVSSYDTAWVAMVPSPDSPQDPCFPECMNWLMDNQLHDGSWGLSDRPSWLVKDALSCTLATVLALKRWDPIESNFASIIDEKQHTPIGFDIIFPGMIEYAKDLNLNLPLRSNDVDTMLQRRQSELRRSYLDGKKEYLAYVSEGMGKLQNWEEIMKYQRKNGSLFNSPSTTAAALTHLQNAGCLHYLRSLLEKFGDSVPAVYPLDTNIHLNLVEILQSLGIDGHFRKEIRTQKSIGRNIPAMLNITSVLSYDILRSTLFAPELSDARISWAKNGVLTTVVDDFFDVGGSEEELLNLVQLVEKWDVKERVKCCSGEVEIIFSALHSTICEMGDKAFSRQGRNVTSHFVEIWLDLLKSMLREAEWTRTKAVPTVDEYMTNAYVSLGLGPIVLLTVYLVGPKLSEEVVRNPELHRLYKLISTFGRLLNDMQGFKRESEEGKLNAVSLHMIHSNITEEEAAAKITDDGRLCILFLSTNTVGTLMSFQYFLNNTMTLSHCLHDLSSFSSSLSDTVKNPRSKHVTQANATILCLERSKERIKKMFDKIELSVSSYDTAWVAMVPSPDSPQDPCFPECMSWLMENQLHDGSWGLPDRPSWLVKDALSCTLASVLALKRWGIGEENMNKVVTGIKFIESKLSSAVDEKQHTPIGFDIIFPGMIEYAKDLNLNLSLRSNDIDTMLQLRQSELRRCYLEGRIEYLAYVSEGIGKLQDWEMVMKYQRKNGSLFNSPSTTAAALTHHLQNAGCLHYLRALSDKFGNADPTVYPSEIYDRLTMVDIVESLGIDRHFRKDIIRVLDETYRTVNNNVKGKHRCWLQGEEEIFLDTTTCAMAFRMLRAHGYDVSADPSTQLAEENQFFKSSLKGNLKDIGAVLELYKASQMMIYPEELVLEKQKL
ncbi:hypothetical protein Q3G72_024934 [Acer saccharum]|nr:hypothetical protein Q3G72_024934 [Acer saccharum]